MVSDENAKFGFSVQSCLNCNVILYWRGVDGEGMGIVKTLEKAGNAVHFGYSARREGKSSAKLITGSVCLYIAGTLGNFAALSQVE